MVQLDTQNIQNSYNRIRDTSEVTWVAYGYDDAGTIAVLSEGADYEGFRELAKDDTRLYCFASFQTGDEMSKRKKFVLITWIGDKVSPMKKAQVSIHKAELKKIIQNVAVDVQTSSKEDTTQASIVERLRKAGGASYGVGGSS